MPPWRFAARQCLHRQPGSDNIARAEPKGTCLQRLWTRREGLAAAAVLALPLPAAAAPIHRIVAVGDLHGDFAAWRAIARAAGLVDAAGRWSGGDAVLVQTGDVVDRGPDSRRLIEELMRLKREAPAGQVVTLVGNHEAMNMTGDLRYLTPADYAAFTDANSARLRDTIYDANKAAIIAANRAHDPRITDDAVKQAWYAATPLGSIEHRIAWGPGGEIGSWVLGNPAVVLLDGTLFLHGGISPAYARMTLDEINARVAAALKAGDTSPKSIINDPLGPLWYRGLAEEPAASPDAPPIAQQLNQLLAAFGARRIVIGHTPVLTGIAITEGGRLIRIDTGDSEVYRGKLSYLEILDGNPVPHAIERSP